MARAGPHGPTSAACRPARIPRVFHVTVTGCFSATHQLCLAGGALEPPHGHQWNVQVTYVADALDEMGVAVDFVVLRKRLVEVLDTLRERCLNDLPAFAERPPSAENVAWYVARQLAAWPELGGGLYSVQVEEEPGCFATYFPTSADSILP